MPVGAGQDPVSMTLNAVASESSAGSPSGNASSSPAPQSAGNPSKNWPSPRELTTSKVTGKVLTAEDQDRINRETAGQVSL